MLCSGKRCCLPLCSALRKCSIMQANSIAQAVLYVYCWRLWDLRKRIIPDSICLFIALTGLMDFSPVRLWGVLAALPSLIAALCSRRVLAAGTSSSTPPQAWCWALRMHVRAAVRTDGIPFFISSTNWLDGSASWSRRRRRRHLCLWRRFCPSAFLP